MPRGPRVISASGVYHVMFRGINRMDILKDDQDNEKFLDILQKMNDNCEYETYAYCLMKNHIHLLIKEVNDSISRSMKRIGVSYSYYFNKKYQRVGHVFQDRYRSESIENERYLLACLRYIHNNPVKAKLVENPYEYRWSSYKEYVYDNSESAVVNSRFILEFFSKDKKEAIKAFQNFSLSEEGKETFLDYDEEQIDKKSKSISSIESILKKYDLRIDNISSCKDKTIVAKAIKELKELEDISILQLSRILSMDRNKIYRIK